jgi:hypothetical protein
MQIAGSRCVVCDQTVGIVREGTACTSCQTVYHTKCVNSSDCPSCGQPLIGEVAAHVLPSAFVRPESDRPASVTIIAWFTYLGVPIGIVMVLAGIGLTASDVGAGIELIVIGALAVPLCAAAGSAFMRGKQWARRLYLWITPAVLGVEIVVGNNAFIEPGFSWWRSALGLGVYAVIAFALTRSRTKAFFNASGRREVRAA